MQARSTLATPVFTLEEAIQLYIGLLEQARQLDQHLKVIRAELLRTMDGLGIQSVHQENLEILRQVRHYPPRLDRAKAEALLRQFGRLHECLVTELDENKARQTLEELRQQGRISEQQLPFEVLPESEVLIVRRAA